MNSDPALMPERIEALNAINLRLIGVTHGITRYVGGIPSVEGGKAEDFDRLMNEVDVLNAERGDRLAIEPTGFRSEWDDDLTLANILPAQLPNTPVSKLDPALRNGIVDFMEKGRQDLYLNNLAYAAAHAVLRGIPVLRAEVSRAEWEALNRLLPEIAPPAMHNEIQLFARNTKMIERLGDIAIDMRSSMPKRTPGIADAEKPTLLFASGRTHTPRLAGRFLGTVFFSAES